MLGVDEMRAWYGPDHVALAADRGAVGTLLISDALFRYETPTRHLKKIQSLTVQIHGIPWPHNSISIHVHLILVSTLSSVTHVPKTSSNDPKERKKYVQLVESVRQRGAEVLIFSSMHESGQREFASFRRGSHVFGLLSLPSNLYRYLLHLSFHSSQYIAIYFTFQSTYLPCIANDTLILNATPHHADSTPPTSDPPSQLAYQYDGSMGGGRS